MDQYPTWLCNMLQLSILSRKSDDFNDAALLERVSLVATNVRLDTNY